MRRLLLSIVLCLIPFLMAAQYVANLSATNKYGHTSVYLSNSNYAELKVKIGQNVSYEDFTVGFTDDLDKADVVITSAIEGNWEPYLSTNRYSDLSVKVTETGSYNDVNIEIKSSGRVDYLLYNDLDKLNSEMLVVAILPIINFELDKEDRLDNIPIFDGSAAGPRYHATPKAATTSTHGAVVVKSQMDDEFEGWEGETVFKLYNGQIWQQVGYEYVYHYAYMPKVTIYQKGGYYFMQVEGIKNLIQVLQLK